MQQRRRPILILDANAFISCSRIPELGQKYRLVTTSDVISEIKDEKTKNYLEKIPFEIEQKDFDEKSLQFVKQFSKKTGDIGSLSDIDMQLVALAHTLYLKQGLDQKIRKNPLPIVQKVVEQEQDHNSQQNQEQQEFDSQGSITEQPLEDEEGWVTVPSKAKKQEEQVDSDIDDEQGWITPVNYEKKMAEINTAYLENTKEDEAQKSTLNTENQQNQQNSSIQQPQLNKQSQEDFQIALVSADFAIQNISTHMGIKLISLDGRVISSIRRFVWECYLCWKQYNVVQNKVKICSNCGYNSLSKISYSMDMNGNVVLHRKKGWKPNLKVQEWKQKKFQQQQKQKRHQHQRRTKKQSIFQGI